MKNFKIETTLNQIKAFKNGEEVFSTAIFSPDFFTECFTKGQYEKVGEDTFNKYDEDLQDIDCMSVSEFTICLDVVDTFVNRWVTDMVSRIDYLELFDLAFPDLIANHYENYNDFEKDIDLDENMKDAKEHLTTWDELPHSKDENFYIVQKGDGGWEVYSHEWFIDMVNRQF